MTAFEDVHRHTEYLNKLVNISLLLREFMMICGYCFRPEDLHVLHRLWVCGIYCYCGSTFLLKHKVNGFCREYVPFWPGTILTLHRMTWLALTENAVRYSICHTWMKYSTNFCVSLWYNATISSIFQGGSKIFNSEFMNSFAFFKNLWWLVRLIVSFEFAVASFNRVCVYSVRNRYPFNHLKFWLFCGMFNKSSVTFLISGMSVQFLRLYFLESRFDFIEVLQRTLSLFICSVIALKNAEINVGRYQIFVTLAFVTNEIL